MNSRRFSHLVLALVLIALVIAPTTVAAKATWKTCTGIESPLALPVPGTEINADGHTHMRDAVIKYLEQSSCPEASGTNEGTLNSWDWMGGVPIGPMWGTFKLVTPYDGGGVWEGTWQGAVGQDGTCAYQGRGRGVEGSVVGMQITVAVDCSTMPSAVTGTIFDPHGQ